MPEETPVVIDQPAGSGDTTPHVQGDETPQVTPETEPEPIAPITFAFAADDTAGEGADENNDGPNVPSSRLREESEKRRAAEATNAQLQHQNVLMQQMLQNSTKNNNAQPVAAEVDPFGDDADGVKARKAVTDVSTEQARLAVEQAKVELRQEFNGRMQQQFGGITASLQLTNKLNEMQSTGLVDETAAKEIGRRVGAHIVQQPAWSNHQEMLADKMWADMMRSGEIKATRRVNPSNPNGSAGSIHQPGGASSGRPSVDDIRRTQDAKILDLRVRFPKSFQNKTDDDLRASMGDVTSEAVPTYDAPPPVDGGELAPHMSFVHTR
jgi:hypothetical protein